MASPGQRILAGVSGGADSVCLLFMLLEYAARFSVQPAAVHVNHGLREDAGEDAEFVRKLCERVQVPFFLREVDVRELAAREKRSLEEAGRILRYRVFEETAREFGADRIAVAHNLNDRAETMLFHLFRGSGVRGLCSIPPVREKIIRPVMCLERNEIEAYLHIRGIPYRTDSTNDEDDYTRNRIRHHLLPAAKQEVSPQALSHMCAAADDLAQLEEYLGMQTAAAEKACVRSLPGSPGGICVSVEEMLRFHPAIQKRLLLALLKRLAPGGKDIARVHVEAALSLFEKEGNRQVDLPFGIRGVRSYGNVFLGREQPRQGRDPGKLFRKVDLAPEEPERPITYDLNGCQAQIRIFFAEKEGKIPENEYTKWFDCDKIIKSPVFRFREKGDYLSLSDGRGGIIHKSLKEYMIQEKIPREDRDRILVLAEDDHVLWLVGWRISEYYKVSGNTKRVLEAKLTEEPETGETEEKHGGAY